MITRFSSRTTDLGNDFLRSRLEGAVSYDRIAGYFCSSFLEIAGEAIDDIRGEARIICNSGLKAQDVAVAGLAAQKMKQEWCEYKPEEVFASPNEMARLGHLYSLLSSEKLKIRVLPDEVYGLMHGKAGVITYVDGRKTAFIGSMNETKSALTTNYEIVWEDTSPEAAEWVQNEFDFFWNSPYAVPLSAFIVSDIQRISCRKEISIGDWKKTDVVSAIAPAVVEEPIYRRDCGLWAHQKYFVARAFFEHKTKGGARLLLADAVGLGKTLQLATSAKLIALSGVKPVLIIAPKILIYQWQDEIYSMLEMPSAVWTGNCWLDETGDKHFCDILQCPRKVGIISQGIITAKTENAERLLSLTYDCVICDEAHRARRKNLNENADEKKCDPNNLLSFLQRISVRTHSMLLATATPIQTHNIEAFDLIEALGRPKDAEKVIGDTYSVWRKYPQTALDIISGSKEPPRIDASPSMVWNIMRDPFPLANDGSSKISSLIGIIRLQTNAADNDYVLPADLYNQLRTPTKDKIRRLYEDMQFVETCNPYIRCIVRRTRALLENSKNPETGMPYLKKIDVVLYGENSNEALDLDGYQKQAYEIAQEFCDLLSQRVRGGGFMSTLMLKRIGSTMIAGKNTAQKMLAWPTTGSLDESLSEEDEDDEEDSSNKIKDLTSDEIACLEKLIKVLESNKDDDPKYIKVLDILQNGVNGSGPWLDKGCIIFSQYYNSAQFVAEKLSKEFSVPVGLYAGGDKSGIYEAGIFRKELKETIKAMVRSCDLKIVVGTDAASEGLNLQMLSTLINLDLPWNPTRLEQRKGRIQRIGQIADRILIYNMRYKGSVEDRVHEVLSNRLKSVYDIFGQIPDCLESVWTLMAQHDEKAAEERINNVEKQNPFIFKYETQITDCGDWEKCSDVLSRTDKITKLKKQW